MSDPYERLARHLQGLVMGYPYADELLGILKAAFSPDEVRVLLSIPNNLDPLGIVPIKSIASASGMHHSRVKRLVEGLKQRGLLYQGMLDSGEEGYALLQVGYGMPQTFFWKGEANDYSKKMAGLVIKYFNVTRTASIYGATGTKVFKYAPAELKVEIPHQGVLPFDRVTELLMGTTKIAVAHCACRVSARILGRTDCEHSLEVCLKYDEMAEFVISRGMAREVSIDEAISILKSSEEEGLVHMVDNVQTGIKHTCNCCGHYCWNVGIIRRRKVKRDALMAVYFLRVTEEDACIGCGACQEVCPVGAVSLVNGKAQVDKDWCIGCGVCILRCPEKAISLVRRGLGSPPFDLKDLFSAIRKEKGMKE